ncbi:MAG: PmoA family protein [Bacteroidales bacterium]
MNKYRLATPVVFVLFLILIGNGELKAQVRNSQKVEFLVIKAQKKVDVTIGGRLITSYCWPDDVYKPVLYPVYTLSGTEITRGFPLRPRAGERNDHIHQVGVWLNYGNVNGFDFWGNGSTGKKSENGGVIKHLDIEQTRDGDGEGTMTVKAIWQDPTGKELLSERTEFHFIVKEHLYIIDRITNLTATGNTISMKDTKEGMFAIRVARQLELPSKEKVPLLDAQGQPGSELAMENKGVTGNYRSSEGITGEAVWSTRAKWMDLYGTINNEKVSVVICDHPKNPSYPTYWHARGYGLFSANPLGGSDFTNGKEVVNFSIPSGKNVTFRYRMIITSGFNIDDKSINDLANDFAARY